MNVLHHPDPHVLEAELLRRVDAVRQDDPLAAVLVLVPTVRLGGHVQRRLAETGRARLGVEVAHFQAVARAALEAAGAPVPRVLPKRVLERVLAPSLEALPPDHGWRRLVRDRPGAVRAILAVVDELREAGIAPQELEREHGTRALAPPYRAYVERLGALETRGLTDRAGFVAAALPHAASWARRFRAALLHGTYELIGAHLDLVRALDRGCEVTVLLPASIEAPAGAYARAFAARHLDSGAPVATGPRSVLGERLAALYEETAEPEPVPRERLGLASFQGAAAEADAAVRRALEAVADGVPPHEIAIVARSLGPYGAALEAALEDRRLPWTGSLEAPLRRDPAVHDLLLVLRCLVEDFPRRAATEALGSPRVRWDAIAPDGRRPPADRADVWSREAGIVGGLDAWRAALPEVAGEVRASRDADEETRRHAAARAAESRGRAERVVAALEAVARRFAPDGDAPFAAHAERIARVAREAIGIEPDDDDASSAARAIAGLLEELRTLDDVAAGGPVPFPDAVAWLEAAIDGTTLPLHAPDLGGVRVLDFMQARGLTFRRVHVLGMHSGSFPRVAREDPFLPDDARRALRERTGRPIPVKLEAEDEERLLLALTLGSASERIDFSWERADDDGRARAPSLALREIARIVLGRPDLEALLESRAGRVPAHPRLALESTLRELGALAPADERLLFALRGNAVEDVDAGLRRRDGLLEAGLAMLRATESFAPGDGAYDGRVGTNVRAEASSPVGAIERLGRCPLQHLFARRLGVAELAQEATALELAPRELGDRVHRVLERVYRDLADAGLPDGDAGPALRRATAALDEAWASETADLEARRRGRLDRLWTIESGRWLGALRAFVEDDLRRLAAGGDRPAELETVRRGTLELGAGVRIAVHGRLDRVVRGEGREIVGDYKTGGSLAARADPTRMLKGESLQVPLYHMLSGGAVVELLGVGPAFAPDADDRDRRPTFSGLDGDAREGLLETLRVLAELEARGTYPMRPGDHCRFCAYRAGCRRSHPPTLHREERTPDARDFRDLSRKSRRDAPTLAAVRARGAGADGGAT